MLVFHTALATVTKNTAISKTAILTTAISKTAFYQENIIWLEDLVKKLS